MRRPLRAQIAGDAVVIDGPVRITAPPPVVSISGPIRVSARIDGDLITVSDDAIARLGSTLAGLLCEAVAGERVSCHCG